MKKQFKDVAELRAFIDAMTPNDFNSMLMGLQPTEQDIIDALKKAGCADLNDLTANGEGYKLGEYENHGWTRATYSVRGLRDMMGLSQAKFCRKYGIPKKTLEGWEYGKSECPSYVLSLLQRAVMDDIARGNY